MPLLRSTPDLVPVGGSVLIVEDDPTIVLLLETLFDEEGLYTAVCTDGGQAYDVIAASQPDLVILDLLLPGRDGMDVLARVKGDARTASIPILVCTAAEDLVQRAAPLLELWQCRVLSKPFDVEVLVATVNLMLAAQPALVPVG